ncbi:RidA family protein [Henriciella aquimarina]|uniref:RidA family protein n=1 Tax=Henriciella aquimarina TaxID=545261 RepID=UPI000A07B4EF|nr:RidA family protein [Henriciella aquimarina]
MSKAPSQPFLALVPFLAVCAMPLTASAQAVFHQAPGASESAPYSTAVVANGEIYLSGGLGMKPGESTLVEGGIGPQTTQILKNFEATLTSLGADMSDVIKCNVYLDDIGDYGAMNEAYTAAFPGNKPARTTVAVEALPREAAVEIACIALAPDQ